MRVALLLSILVGVGHFASASPTESSSSSYLVKEDPIALQKILDNIGPNLGANPGIVVASPSTEDPNYLYTWTRDAALTMKSLIDRVAAGTDKNLTSTIEAYIKVQGVLQRIPNLSGNFSDLSGLGDPKYNINATEYTGSWGRPQRDGPALRSTALIAYGNYAQKHGNNKFVTETLWPILKNDLDYVTKYWNLTGYDLWEETLGSSFFTISASYRALTEGAAFASKLGHSSSSYVKQAENILCYLQSFWDESANGIDADIDNGIVMRAVDSGTTVGIIHGFDYKAGCDASTFQPCSDNALAHHYKLASTFRPLYPLNTGTTTGEAFAIGRYSTTLAAAEQLYDSLYVWKRQGSLEVTDISLNFFNQFGIKVKVGTYRSRSSSSKYRKLVSAIEGYADGFVEIVAQYTPSNGGLHEQFSGWNGTTVSARDLTWSYASVLTTKAAKDGNVPASWGATTIKVPIGKCNLGPEHAVFNDIIDVKFSVTDMNLTTSFGTQLVDDLFADKFFIFVVELICRWQYLRARRLVWSTSAAVELYGVSGSYGLWSNVVKLPPSTAFEYKFIEKLDCPQALITWENYPGGGNREGKTPSKGSLTLPKATFEH